MPWGDPNMEGVPNDMGRFYVQRGTVQRQQEMGLGLQSTGMHDVEPVPADRDSKGISYGSSITPTQASRPSVPPRSPSRVANGNEFF
jgi:hypothetical protein